MGVQWIRDISTSGCVFGYLISDIWYLAMCKSDLREIGGSVLLCFFAAIDSSGDGKAKSGLKIFVTQKLTAWQRF